MLVLILVVLVGACSARDSYLERVRGGMERCCARDGTCDALDCRLYREFRDSYRHEALEAQCREPLLYALWPPHRARSVRFDCLAGDHFMARLEHDIRLSDAQANALDAKEVQFLCIVDPRAIAHPQYRHTERVLGNGTRVRKPCSTTFLRGVDADLLWRYLRAAAAPAAFSEIHVRAPRGVSRVRARCADGNRSLLTLNAAAAVRRLLPELRAGERRQRTPLRVLAHVYGVDARAHCVLCEYRDGMPTVKMKKFETSVSVYPHHRRVTEPQRRAPPWARRDRLRVHDSLWCAGYRALLALHRPQILLQGGARYRPRRARRCHVLAIGGTRVIKLVLGDAAQLTRLRLPAYALHVTLRWSATGSRWKPMSVSVVRLGAAGGVQRRRLARTRWLPRRRTYYARALTFRASAGHYLTIDTLGVEYFEDGTPERFSRSIDGLLDHDGDTVDMEWAEGDLAMPKEQNFDSTKPDNQTSLAPPPLITILQRENSIDDDKLRILTADVTKSKGNKIILGAAIKEETLAIQITDINPPNVIRKVDKSSILINNSSIHIAVIKEGLSSAQTTDVKTLAVIITNVEKCNTPATNISNEDKLSYLTTYAEQTAATQSIDEDELSAQSMYPKIITNLDTSSTKVAHKHKLIQKTSQKVNAPVSNTAETVARDFYGSMASTKPPDYLKIPNVKLSGVVRRSSLFDQKENRPAIRVILTSAGILLFAVFAAVCTLCFVKMGKSPCCSRRGSKDPSGSVPQTVDTGGALGAAAARDSGGGALDVVVQSLIVAQGVTIALAARMLYHLWHANQGASGGTPVVGGKLP